MEKILNQLERRFGKYALGNLTYYLIGIQAVVFVLNITRKGFESFLALDAEKVLAGQVWRLITWVFIPPSDSPIFILFALYWLYIMGTSLEGRWGAFKFELYWIVGMLGTTLVAFFLDIPVTNAYLILSLFLAFATLWPDYSLMIFFVLPVKVKWLALLSAAGLLVWMSGLEGFYKLIPLIAIANYLLFFGQTLYRAVRKAVHQAGRAKDLHQFKTKLREVPPPKRSCSLCGLTDADPRAEFRICSCEKCAKPTEYCLEHAWKH